jgi:hypothetical protein
MNDLEPFFNYIIPAARAKNQDWDAEQYEMLQAKLKGMKNDVAHSHLMKFVREYKAIMDACDSPIDPEHGVAWSRKLNCQQAIEWMEGRLNLPNQK